MKDVPIKDGCDEWEGPLKVEIEWSYLQRIAEYYQFSSAVFLGNKKMFRHKTRNQALTQKAQLFDKIKELVEQEDKL